MAITVETKINGQVVNTTTTATPTADSVPVADGSGKLASGWGGAASSLATLNGSTLVVENPANATTTPTASSIPLADGSGKLAAGWGGAASSLATLDGAGLLAQDLGNLSYPVWTKYTVAATAFTAAAATEDIELFSLAARGTIHRVVIKHTTAFSGGTLSALTLSVGITGTLTKYAAAFDVFQATGDAVFGFNDLPDMETFGSATSIRVAASATGDTLDNVGTGSADIWVLSSVLPA